MKIKSKKNIKKASGGYKVPLFDNSGFNTVPGATESGTNLSQNWGNANTDTSSTAKSKGKTSASQIGGYVAAGAQALSPLWTSSDAYKAPEQTTANTVGNSIKGVASNIPIAGAFVQAGSMLGEGFQTGTNKAYDNINKGIGNKATNQHGANAMSFFKGMTDPISNYSSIADAKKKGLISTGDAVGMGLSHLIGGSGISEAILQKKLNNYNQSGKARGIDQTQYEFNPREEVLGANPQMAKNGGGLGYPSNMYKTKSDSLKDEMNYSEDKFKESRWGVTLDGTKPGNSGYPEYIEFLQKQKDYERQYGLENSQKRIFPGQSVDSPNYAFGGSLEHYNLPQHKELPEDLANTQMDGKGVQLEKNETMLKFPDGKNKTNQDYSFSPNLGFNKKGIPTINEKEVKQTFADASKKIESKKTFGFDRANQNSQKYAFNKLIEVAEATREAKEGNPNMQLANGGVNKYANSGFDNKWNLPQLKKGTIGAPKIIGASNFKQTIETPQINAWDFYSPENGKTKNKIVNDKVGMSTGDKIQLAGSVVAPLTNLAMFLANKSEKVKENLDNTQYSDPRVAKNYNPLYLAENAAKQSINDNSTSDAVRRANLIGLSSNMAGKAQDYSLGVDGFNSNAMLQRDNMIAGTNRFNAQARTQRDDLQAQNDARRRAFLTAGASQAGQTITEAGKASNASAMNNVYGNILKNYSADYSMDKDGNITFKKKANGGTLKMKKKK